MRTSLSVRLHPSIVPPAGASSPALTNQDSAAPRAPSELPPSRLAPPSCECARSRRKVRSCTWERRGGWIAGSEPLVCLICDSPIPVSQRKFVSLFLWHARCSRAGGSARSPPLLSIPRGPAPSPAGLFVPTRALGVCLI